MTASSDIEIGHVVEVNGERALVELHVDTTVALAEDYLPGQPGSHVKIAVRDRSVIGIVSSISMNDPHLSSAARDTTCPSAGRKIADCILIGSMGANGGFIRGVAVYPTVGQSVKMLRPDELKSIFSEYNEYDFSFGHPSQAEDQRAYINVDRFFGQHIAVVGSTGCGKSCTVV
jgi:hypothetical protein